MRPSLNMFVFVLGDRGYETQFKCVCICIGDREHETSLNEHTT